MPRRPKNKNKEKHKGATSELSAVEAATLFNVTRTTIYRWRKDKKKTKGGCQRGAEQVLCSLGVHQATVHPLP
ncbi:hypothetical protein JG687_00015799 [Phytophthora cactorum]|uniref:Homeodomain-like n=1 Tax=Phytophthora cactorum TaxID=29920 RepID=A0A8T1TXS3_9STRA|nr:hypothetical protein JG687_00015799 [Phytophthora cactorum]